MWRVSLISRHDVKKITTKLKIATINLLGDFFSAAAIYMPFGARGIINFFHRFKSVMLNWPVTTFFTN